MSDRRANIVLTGFMGTGKTSTGRHLARLLERDFVDTDELIESRHGPIEEIFADDGEPAFRELERGVADELGRRRGLVIATGGKLMLDDHNVDALTRHGRVFCLTASTAEIVERVSGDGPTRPLLAGDDPEDRVRRLLTSRAQGYARFHQIETGGRTPLEVAEAIAELVS